MSQNELTHQWGPEKMINVTQAGEIRGMMHHLNILFSADRGVQLIQVLPGHRIQEVHPTLPIPEAPPAGLGSRLYLLPFHQDNHRWKLLQECHLSSLCKEVAEKRC